MHELNEQIKIVALIGDINFGLWSNIMIDN